MCIKLRELQLNELRGVFYSEIFKISNFFTFYFLKVYTFENPLLKYYPKIPHILSFTDPNGRQLIEL